MKSTNPSPHFPIVTGLPVGSVTAFAGYINTNPISSPPSTNDYCPEPPPQGYGYTNLEATGWMVCDGRSLYCKAYPTLFLVLGFLYSQPGDSYAPGYTGNIPEDATFRLPDYRGYFLRMVSGTGSWPGGANPDPDVSKRYMTYDKNTLSTGIGSIETDAFQTHTHAYALANMAGTPSQQGSPLVVPPTSGFDALTSDPSDNKDGSAGTTFRTSTETRPLNMYVYYLIKYV